MRIFYTTALLLCYLSSFAQPNCEAYKYYGDELKYKACKVADKRNGHYQFSRAYQEALDEAIEIDSTFAFAHKAKSTAYLKSGDFITWKKLMDTAIKYDERSFLDYRGWCRFQFFRDYEGALQDIEKLDSIMENDIGYSQNGDYHLHVARALCYKALGNQEKAIQIMELQLQEESHMSGRFDYIHLGKLYLEVNQLDKAIAAFKRQEQENDLAENRFYIALVYKQIGDTQNYLTNLEVAKEKYQNEIRMFDPYVEQIDKIYLSDIEDELKLALKE